MHETSHQPAHEGEHIQTIYRGLVEDTQRTRSICGDITAAEPSGRSCLVLTRWTEHLEVVVEMLASEDVEPLVLHGKMGKKARTAVTRELAEP